MYILAFLPSATVIRLSISTPASSCMSITAFATSDSLPTPDGSMMMRSGWNSSLTCFSDFAKSPTSVQQMHPEFISVTSMPEFCMKRLSIPISPNSFSMSTVFSSLYAFEISSFMNVVFPAPRNPDIISTFAMIFSLFCKNSGLRTAARFAQGAARHPANVIIPNNISF